MKTNRKTKHQKFTHEGGVAVPHLSSIEQLRRSVMSCMLWESEFYEDGQSIYDRIVDTAKNVDVTSLCHLAVEVREQGNLRHVSLVLLLAAVERGGSIVGNTIARVIKRPDELTEILSLYWLKGKRPLSTQLKRGLALAFQKFDEYQLAKYNRDGAIKLRDVLFLCHAKPVSDVQDAIWKRLINGTLATPNTWETRLSAGQDKKTTFEDLIRSEKIGYMALLRNLRNMVEADVDPSLVKGAIQARKGAGRVLPFRYVAAARHAPRYEKELDVALNRAISEGNWFNGETVILVDVSASMNWALSGRSEMNRMDAAATLGSMINGYCRVFSFSNRIVEVPHRMGMSGVDAIIRSQPHSGTDLRGAVKHINENIKHDRLIVITDEQTWSKPDDPVCERAYMINVASAQNGVGYGKWTHIDGFSENVLRYIHELESFGSK